MAAPKNRSTLFYVGLAFGVAVLLIVLGGLFVVFRGLSNVGQQLDSLRDPVKRDEKVRALLQAQVLPDSFQPAFALELKSPISFAVVSLTDGKVVDGRTEDERRGFSYFEAIDEKGDMPEVLAMLRGEHSRFDLLKRFNIELNPRDVLTRGELDVQPLVRDAQAAPAQPLHVTYMSYLGQIKVQGAPVDGASTIFAVQCPSDQLFRAGLFFTRHGQELARLRSLRHEGADAERTDSKRGALEGADTVPAPVTASAPSPVTASAPSPVTGSVPAPVTASVPAPVTASADVVTPVPVADSPASSEIQAKAEGTLIDPDYLRQFLEHFALCNPRPVEAH
ncbi:MAG: hypothetical protein ACKO6N_09580 [Myxococcota bacterium]